MKIKISTEEILNKLIKEHKGKERATFKEWLLKGIKETLPDKIVCNGVLISETNDCDQKDEKITLEQLAWEMSLEKECIEVEVEYIANGLTKAGIANAEELHERYARKKLVALLQYRF